MMTQRDGSGGAPTIGPRTISSMVTGPGADPVGEPARVGNFIDGVEVLRAAAGRLVAGLHEEVVDHLVQVPDFGDRGARRVLRLWLASDRVVAIETRARGRTAPGR